MRNLLSMICALALVGPVMAEPSCPTDNAAFDQNIPLEVDTKDPSLKKIILIAGSRSHGPCEHEHFAGMALVMKMLQQNPGVFPVLCRDGWPKNEEIFKGASAVVLQSDGGGGHPFLQAQRLAFLDDLAKQGIGIACIHYGVEPTIKKGQPEFLRWIGGAFEINWSVNPHWEADFAKMPDHPITRGVQPFKISDEWYFHMRFTDKMKGVTPILSAVAPASTMSRGDGPHSGNPAVREAVAKGEMQHMAWAYEREDGKGRGFGFTGAHFHKNYADVNFRRIIVNAALWVAHAEIPEKGARCDLADGELYKHLDDKRPKQK